MTDIAALRRAVQYCRDNPEKWNQGRLHSGGSGCVLGWVGYFHPDIQENFEGSLVSRYDAGYVNGKFIADKIGLEYDDYAYIYSTHRTLNQIESYINEIEARENPAVEFINIRIRERVLNIPASALSHVIAAARAVDPEVEIIKLVEEKL